VFAATRARTNDHAVHAVSDADDAHRRSFDGRDVRIHILPTDVYAALVEHHFVLVPVDSYEISHADSGTSSQPVSTCAVCGNMSTVRNGAVRSRGMRARSRPSVAGSQLT